jgi:hypothetical protein
MTVKELKEKLEIIIEDGKGDYKVCYLDDNLDEFVIAYSDRDKEVYL